VCFLIEFEAHLIPIPSYPAVVLTRGHSLVTPGVSTAASATPTPAYISYSYVKTVAGPYPTSIYFVHLASCTLLPLPLPPRPDTEDAWASVQYVCTLHLHLQTVLACDC